MEEKTQKQQKGGRGAMLLKALESKTRQPQQVPPLAAAAAAATTTPQPAVPPSLGTGARGVLGATALPLPHEGEDLPSPPPQSMSRGQSLFAQIMQKRSGFRGTSSLGTTILESSLKRPGFARGHTELMQADLVGTITMQPGAKPLQACCTKSSDEASVTESLQHLTVSEEEQEPVKQHGTLGTKFLATSNWIMLSLEANKAIFQYEVKFEPKIDDLRHRYHLFNSCKEQMGSVKSFHDTVLWLPTRLSKEISVFRTTSQYTGEEVVIKVTFKRTVKMDECVQFYNVLFNRIMRKLKMAKVGKNYYAPGGSVMVPQHKLEIWPGYVTSVNYREGGLMICVDVSHRVLRTETCYDTMADLCRRHRGNYKDTIISALIGCVVLTRYNNKTYCIDDVLFDQNPTCTFTNHEGKEVSYVDYYLSVYGIKIRDLQQPLLCHRLKKKELKDQGTTKFVCLIPELCYMTGLTDEMRSDFHVMKDVAQHTRITPNVRHASLRTFIKNVNENEEARQVLADWGLGLEDSSHVMQGRIHVPETIYFGNHEVQGSHAADWSRESSREKVIVPVDLKPHCWMIIYCVRDQNCARSFCNMMKMVDKNMGIQVGEPLFVQLRDDRIESYVTSLRQHYHKELQLAVVIFPTQREDRYSAVKRLACVDLCLPTQCILSRTISQERKLRAVTQKIALQINCKLGGELWALKIPLNGLMVCGIDVYHDKSKRGSSVVGFVASINQTLTKWFSLVSFQHPGDEIVHKLKTHLLESLRHYHRVHHALPRFIIVFRDGVSEGHLSLVKNHEIPQMATVFQHFDSYHPKLSFIVVQKRINTRIFAVMASRGYDNPPPGCVIDLSITYRNWYDFFLVSQQVRQGSVSPTHYIVVHDESSLKVDNMQRLAYKLTHLYYNWPGTVRVPAPCLYAHKLAYLIGQCVKKDPAVGLCDKLFYL